MCAMSAVCRGVNLDQGSGPNIVMAGGGSDTPLVQQGGDGGQLVRGKFCMDDERQQCNITQRTAKGLLSCLQLMNVINITRLTFTLCVC